MRTAGEGQKLLNKKTELWLSGGCSWSWQRSSPPDGCVRGLSPASIKLLQPHCLPLSSLDWLLSMSLTFKSGHLNACIAWLPFTWKNHYNLCLSSYTWIISLRHVERSSWWFYLNSLAIKKSSNVSRPKWPLKQELLPRASGQLSRCKGLAGPGDTPARVVLRKPDGLGTVSIWTPLGPGVGFYLITFGPALPLWKVLPHVSPELLKPMSSSLHDHFLNRLLGLTSSRIKVFYTFLKEQDYSMFSFFFFFFWLFLEL